MSTGLPTRAGWYPDTETGGTAYWDGARWTGDLRPRRRPFAAASHETTWVGVLAMMGGGLGVLMFLGFGETQETTYAVLGVGILLVTGAACIYFLRGQGPTTQEVEARLAAERRQANAKRRKANLWGVVAGVERLARPRSSAPTSGEAALVAQIDALSDPRTAQSLQNLQKLLYTRAITDAEYEAAKNKLVGDPNDAFAQIAKLAELHEAGILGDVEFAAAKAKALAL